MPYRQTPIDHDYFANERTGGFSVIGSAVPRADARGHVTGRTEFFEDIRPAGLLHLKMHRSTRHHARLVSVDADAARAVPGVVTVLTYKDIPNNLYTPPVHPAQAHRGHAGRRADPRRGQGPLRRRADLCRGRGDRGGRARRCGRGHSVL
jgi:CO/xanthine dehydrogenase Mo-binding subunit